MTILIPCLRICALAFLVALRNAVKYPVKTEESASGGNLAQGIINASKNIIQTSSTAQNMIKNFQETVKIYQQGKEYYDRLKSVHNLVKDARKVQKSILLIGEISDIYGNINGLSMSDKERMDVIDRTYNAIRNYRDLVSYYTRKNISVSYLRAKKQKDTDRVMALYGSADERYW